MSSSVASQLFRSPVKLYDPESPTAEVVFDAVVNVQHRGQTKVTRYPVEKGSDVSDHAKSEPREIQLAEAIVSNFPAQLTVGERLYSDAAGGAWEQLERWRQGGTLLTLVTDLCTYDSVAIESLDVPRDAKRSNSMHATLMLIEVNTVETKSTKAPEASKDRAQPVKEKAKQVKNPVEIPSLRTKALNALRGFLPAAPTP